MAPAPPVTPLAPALPGLAVAPPLFPGPAVAPPVLPGPATPDSFADPAELGETPVPDPLVLPPLPELPPDPDDVDPSAGWLLGALLGAELADDDGFCSA